MSEKVDLLIDYRKKAINLITSIMVLVTLLSGVFRLVCIPLDLFKETPVAISIGYVILGILEVLYMRAQVKRFNEVCTEESYKGIKMMLIFSNVLNLLLCFICFPAFNTWSLTIFFVAALAFLQEKKLTIISLICNFTMTAIYLLINFTKFMAAPNLLEESIMLGLAFSVDILYIFLNIHLITNTLASTGNMVANASVSKLQVTLNNINQKLPKLDGMSDDLVSITESNNASTNSIVEASQNMLAYTEEIATTIEESHESIDHVSENASEIAESIKDVCKQYNYVVNDITDSAAVLENIQKSGKDVIDSTAQVLDVTEQLETSIGEINEITRAIKGISNQTKIVALNALIEAARVGEAGKGFSVVAERVQEMAQSTANTVKGMDIIVGNIYDAMDVVKKSVDSSVQEVTKQNESITQIVRVIEDAISKIKTTSNELMKVSEKSKQHKQYAVELVEKNDTILNRINDQAEKVKQVVEFAEHNKTDVNKLSDCVRELEETVKVLSELSKTV